MCARYKYIPGGLDDLRGIMGDETYELKTPGFKTAGLPNDPVERPSGGIRGDNHTGNVVSPEDVEEKQPSPVPVEDIPMDAFPGYLAEIFVFRDSQEATLRSSFGLVPPWLPKGKKKPLCLYNARSETLTQLPSFRDAFRLRRCVVKLTVIEENMGKYEWLEVHPANQKAFYIAGLYNEPSKLCETYSHSLVTTVPNKKIETYHDRMPVVLDVEGIKKWLNPKTPVLELLSLCKPCPDEWIGEITTRQDDAPRRRRGNNLDFDF